MAETVVPQWSTLLAESAHRPRPKPRTDAKKIEGLISGSRSSSISKTAVGTWITQGVPMQNSLKVSSALKEDQHPVMNKIITGTSPSFDLNTPEIKFEDFAFGKTIGRHNNSNMEVGNSLATYEQDVNLESSLLGDCLTADVSNTSVDSYTMFDMSPGYRDPLQSDQFEQRMDIHELMSGETHNDSTNESSRTSTSIPGNVSSLTSTSIPEIYIGLPQSQITSRDCPEATVLSQPQILESSVPQETNPLQLKREDDLSFTYPQEVLELMENLFPEAILSDTSPANNNVNSTELDMYLGTHSDLLSGALEESGLMDHDLGSFKYEDSETTFSTVGVEAVPMPISNNQTQDHNAFVQSMLDPSSFITEPITVISDPVHQSLLATPTPRSPLSEPITVISDPIHQSVLFATPTPGSSSTLSTPTPSTLFAEPITFLSEQFHQSLTTPSTSVISTPTCPRPPSKKRAGEDVTTPVVGSIKRQRRASKKPLRFRESEGFVNSTQDELLLDNALEEVKVAGRQREEQTFVQVKEERPDFTSNPTVGGTRRCSTQNLTDVQKYHRIRVLNNEASKRCRQKRKMTIKEMEKELSSLGERNKILTEKHAALEKLRDKFQAYVNNYFRQRLSSNK